MEVQPINQEIFKRIYRRQVKKEVYGRPVGVAVIHDGSLVLADNAGNTIWKVSAKK
ncbi:MAG: hypothetical protein ABIR15_05880 [Chitinophagaceae bacterium]